MTDSNPHQIRVLRLMAAGVRLKPRDLPHVGGLLFLPPSKQPIGRVHQRSITAMVDAGLIEGQSDGFFHLTAAGRARTEVGVFVRHYAETLRTTGGE
jgi:hypothetical protein